MSDYLLNRYKTSELPNDVKETDKLTAINGTWLEVNNNGNTKLTIRYYLNYYFDFQADYWVSQNRDELTFFDRVLPDSMKRFYRVKVTRELLDTLLVSEPRAAIIAIMNAMNEWDHKHYEETRKEFNLY